MFYPLVEANLQRLFLKSSKLRRFRNLQIWMVRMVQVFRCGKFWTKSSDEVNSACLAQEGWVLPPWQWNVLKMHQQPLQLSRTGGLGNLSPAGWMFIQRWLFGYFMMVHIWNLKSWHIIQGILAKKHYNRAWRIASCQLSVVWLVWFGPRTFPSFMRCLPKMHKMPVVSVTRRCFGSDWFQILWEHHLVQISMTCLVIAGCCRKINMMLQIMLEFLFRMQTQGYNTLLNAHAKAADGAQAKEAALF